MAAKKLQLTVTVTHDGLSERGTTRNLPFSKPLELKLVMLS